MLHAAVCLPAVLVLLTHSITRAQPPITALAFTQDSKQLIAGSQSRLKIHEWPSLRVVDEVITDLDHIHDIAFSKDGRHFVAVGGRPSEYGEVEVHAWPGKSIIATNVEHDDTIQAAVWHDSLRLTTVAADTQVISWRLRDDRLELLRRLKGHSRRVLAVTRLAESNILVTGGVDHSLRVWAADKMDAIRVLDNHTDIVHDLAARPGEYSFPYVASASADRTARFWQPTIGRLVRFARLPSEPLSVAWSPRGDLLAAACIDGVVRLINPDNVKIQEQRAFDGWAYEVAAAPNGSGFAVGGERGRLVRIAMK